MIQEEQIIIPLGKTKLYLLVFGALAFFALGALFVTYANEMHLHFQNNPGWKLIFRDPRIFIVIGVVAMAFFGLCAVISFNKLFDNKPGLIINSEGITDNASGVAAGLIPWSDIEEIKTIEIEHQKIMMLIVKNPEDYLDRVENPFKRKMMELNHQRYGSPVAISAITLKTDFKKLHELLKQKLNEHKQFTK